MNTSSFPPDLRLFIAQQIAEGKYQSEEELMIHAVRVLREVQAHKQQFAEDIQLGLDQLERGKYVEYDEEGLRRHFEELKTHIKNRISERYNC
jgi:Arc/MetJ-type ribon-helix-helix transcriptional regulator